MEEIKNWLKNNMFVVATIVIVLVAIFVVKSYKFSFVHYIADRVIERLNANYQPYGTNGSASRHSAEKLEMSNQQIKIAEIHTGIPAYIAVNAPNYRHFEVFALLDYSAKTLWIPSEVDRNMIGDVDSFCSQVFEHLEKKQKGILSASLPDVPNLNIPQSIIANIQTTKERLTPENVVN